MSDNPPLTPEIKAPSQMTAKEKRDFILGCNTTDRNDIKRQRQLQAIDKARMFLTKIDMTLIDLDSTEIDNAFINELATQIVLLMNDEFSILSPVSVGHVGS